MKKTAWLVCCLWTTLYLPTSLAWNARPKVDLLSLGGHVGAAVGATAELAEEFESIGHHHGMLLLCASKMCRELNVMREATVEQVEELEEETNFSLMRPLAKLFYLLTSKWVAVSLSLAALAAAFAEVWEDFSPGGHHGAVLLAINELLELLEQSRVARGRVLRGLKNSLFRIALLGGATILALVETVGDMGCKKLGSHHGVLILAFAKALRSVGLLNKQLKEKNA